MRLNVATMTPHDFKRYQQTHDTSYTYFRTAAGILKITVCDKGIYQAQFCGDANGAAFPTLSPSFDDTKFLLVGTPFQLKVWQALLEMPARKTCSYIELAQSIDHPRSWRAVANAVGQNPIAYFVPCHRVVRKNGQLGGYRWGSEIKEQLLQSEGMLF